MREWMNGYRASNRDPRRRADTERRKDWKRRADLARLSIVMQRRPRPTGTQSLRPLGVFLRASSLARRSATTLSRKRIAQGKSIGDARDKGIVRTHHVASTNERMPVPEVEGLRA